MRIGMPVFACLVIFVIGCSSSGKPKGTSFLEESPIDGTSSIMTFAKSDVGGEHVADKSMSLMCECARITLEKGYTYFLIEDHQQGEDGRASFKISFFKEPPKGLPVFGPDTEMEGGVVKAEDIVPLCDMMKKK